ncbi:MAG: biotin--[acetyl-CoA-carboxylase] ligase [Clostridia bacterium]|nr:biotin--[acetyl-CoA-carboxylase] ligase [Clostridia bacterium]
MKLTKLKTNYIARHFIYYDEIDSTQNEIWRLMEENKIVNGTMVACDIQTAGKGTHGRNWVTDEQGNIAFSLYIETDCPIEKLDGLTLDLAKILVEILKEDYNIDVDIKDPNDLLLNNKKIGGILTESKIHGNNVKYIVIGIGINTTKMTFEKDLENIATSIKKECGIEVDREELIARFCNRLEENINKRVGTELAF